MDLRIRLLGALIRRQSISSMTPDQVASAQTRTLPHNRATELLFGGLAAGVETEDRTMPGPGGDVALRIYRPRGPGPARPLVVNFHGGGWVLGSVEQNDHLCSTVAAGVGAVVVSVGYRLAPSHPFPAATEDCYAALVWAAENAGALGADASRIGVMGDSAGGNLAAVVALTTRDRGGPPLAHQALIYPVTDATRSGDSYRTNAHAPVLSAEDMATFCRYYLAADTDPRSPSVSPLFAPDHTGLAPALVQVAELDPLRDDGVRYAAALRVAGTPVRFTEYVGMPHGFVSFPTLCRSAPQALAEVCQEQRAALHGPPGPG